MNPKHIPNYELYEESTAPDRLESLHCEPIQERSSLHNWTIKPHRHNQLYQIFAFTSGRGVASIDDQTYTIGAMRFFVVPPLCVHGLELSENTEGYVISALSSEFHDALATTSSLVPLFEYPVALPNKIRRGSFLLDSVIEFQRTFRSNQIGRVAALRSLLRLILIELSRKIVPSPPLSAQEQSHDEARFARFLQLVDKHYQDHHPTSFYASELNITPSKLLRLTKKYSDTTPHTLVANKLLLESKRYLLYTSMSLGQITAALGMRDPAYFSRFFRRNTGVSPGKFRQRPLRSYE